MRWMGPCKWRREATDLELLPRHLQAPNLCIQLSDALQDPCSVTNSGHAKDPLSLLQSLMMLLLLLLLLFQLHLRLFLLLLSILRTLLLLR